MNIVWTFNFTVLGSTGKNPGLLNSFRVRKRRVLI
jgi:hypothetical protein